MPRAARPRSTPRCSTLREWGHGAPKHSSALACAQCDPLWHLPRRYEDRRRFSPVRLLSHGAAALVSTGHGSLYRATPRPGDHQNLLVDDSGSAHLTWYNQPYMVKRFPVGTHLVAYGKVERRFGAVQILNPNAKWSPKRPGGDGANRADHPLTEGLSQQVVRNVLFSLMELTAKMPIHSRGRARAMRAGGFAGGAARYPLPGNMGCV